MILWLTLILRPQYFAATLNIKQGTCAKPRCFPFPIFNILKPTCVNPHTVLYQISRLLYMAVGVWGVMSRELILSHQNSWESYRHHWVVLSRLSPRLSDNTHRNIQIIIHNKKNNQRLKKMGNHHKELCLNSSNYKVVHFIACHGIDGWMVVVWGKCGGWGTLPKRGK